MALMQPPAVEQLLQQALLPEGIRTAEATLKQALGQPTFMCALAERLCFSTEPQVRQLAAVLMRRRIGSHWTKLDATTQHGLKASLLESVTNEPERSVRRNVANVVAVIAKHTLPRGEWNELFTGLLNCTRSASEQHREVAMLMLSSLLESEEVVECLQPHFPMLCQVLHAALGEQGSVVVPREALKAVGAWAGTVLEGDDASLLKPLLPTMLQVGARATGAGAGAPGAPPDEETVKVCCSILDDCVESASGVANSHIAAILEFASDTARCRRLETETCGAALNLIATVLAHKRKLVCRQKLVAPATLVLFEICAENDEADDDDDDDSPSLHKLAAQVLDVMARHLPSKHVMPAILEQVALHNESPDPHRRRAVLVSLAVMAEGCCEAFVSKLEQLLPLLYKGCADGDIIVREAACIALGQFAQFLQPEIISHYQQILPCIFQVMADATEQVKEKSCYALEAFCENLGEEIVPFLQPLLQRLTELLQSGSRKTQEMCVSAIASVAMAAGEQFRPYHAQTYALMRLLLQQRGDAELLLRSRAMECVGLMNLAVGRAHCEAILPECTELALGGLELELPELKEYTYGFFAQTAELVGGDIAHLLPRLLPHLLKSLEADDTFEWSGGDADDAAGAMKATLAALNGGGGGGEGGGEDDDDDEDDEAGGGGRGGTLSVRTSLLDEKAAAAHTIGACAEHGGAAMMSHLPRCLAALQQQEDYFHEDVRTAVARAMRQLVQTTLAHELPHATHPPPPPGGKPPSGPPPLPWVKGAPADPSSLPQSTRQLLEQVLPTLLSRFQLDDDKDTVAAASESIAEIAKLVGPTAVADTLGGLAEVAAQLLQQQHPCQAAGLDGDEVGLDEDADHDEALWEAVSELLTTLPKVVGAAWQPHLGTLLPSLLPYLGSGHPASDRSLAVGVLAESCHQLEAAAAPFCAQLLPIALRHSADDDATCRQNATFCLGVLGHFCPAEVLGHMQQLLTALQPRLAEEEEPPVRDNAIGALGRLILAHTTALPLDAIVPACLARLPLQADAGENTPALRALMKLTHDEATRATMAPHVPQLLSVIGRSLGTSSVDAQLNGEIAQFLQWLTAEVPPQQLAQAAAALPETERTVLASAGLSALAPSA